MKESSLEEIYFFYKNKANSKICTDTRKIIPGSLFIALKGENFDGNTFVPSAIEKGCAGAITSDTSYADFHNVFYVHDTLKTLQNLANYHRKRFHCVVIGIGGSNGKTTHKELMHAVLSKKYRSVATQGNLNNHIGVPLTLLSVDETNTDFLVLEMGANHQGEYSSLCKIAEPDYGLLTNIGRDHLEGFGGWEGVKKGNGELYDYIKNKKRKIFLNLEDALLKEMSEGIEYIGYGNHPQSIVRGKVVNEDPLEIEWTSDNYTHRLSTHFTGRHYLPNILAAIAAGIYWNVSREDIHQAISSYVPKMNRSEKVLTLNNELILDAYNANPDSMKAAIDSFLRIPRPEKFLILGDMFELGKFAYEEHQRICDYLIEKNFSEVLLIGKEFFACRTNFLKFTSTAECKNYLQKHPLKNKYILLKGSRGMQLEQLKDVL